MRFNFIPLLTFLLMAFGAQTAYAMTDTRGPTASPAYTTSANWVAMEQMEREVMALFRQVQDNTRPLAAYISSAKSSANSDFYKYSDRSSGNFELNREDTKKMRALLAYFEQAFSSAQANLNPDIAMSDGYGYLIPLRSELFRTSTKLKKEIANNNSTENIDRAFNDFNLAYTRFKGANNNLLAKFEEFEKIKTRATVNAESYKAQIEAEKTNTPAPPAPLSSQNPYNPSPDASSQSNPNQNAADHLTNNQSTLTGNNSQPGTDPSKNPSSETFGNTPKCDQMCQSQKL